MTTETMTIHEALSELKIIGDRIESAIRKEFVTVNKKSNKKVNGIPIDDVVANQNGGKHLGGLIQDHFHPFCLFVILLCQKLNLYPVDGSEGCFRRRKKCGAHQ